MFSDFPHSFEYLATGAEVLYLRPVLLFSGGTLMTIQIFLSSLEIPSIVYVRLWVPLALSHYRL